MMQDDVSAVDLHNMNIVGNAIARIMTEALHEAAQGILDSAPNASEPVVLAGCINGGISGVMQFMADKANQGLLTDPDEKIELMFKLAADIWAQIRGGPAGTAGAVQ